MQYWGITLKELVHHAILFLILYLFIQKKTTLTIQYNTENCYTLLRGKKLNYKSVPKEISKPPFCWLLKSSGHQSLPCLFDSRFLQMFRTTPIFGLSRDHNRKCLKTRTEWIVLEIQLYVLRKHGIIYNL